MSSLSRFILPGLVGILAILISPMIIQESSSLEALSVLESGVISTPSNDYPISNNFEMKVFHGGELIRIKGITASGYPYYVYQNMIDGNAHLGGKIFIDGKMLPIVNKFSFIQEPEKETLEIEKETLEIEKETLELEKKNLAVTVDSKKISQFYERYFIKVRVFDADINPNPKFSFTNDGILTGISVKADLIRPTGEIIATMEGTTDSFGYYEGSYLWGYNELRGDYGVNLDVDDGNYLEELQTSYRGYIKPRSSPPP